MRCQTLLLLVLTSTLSITAAKLQSKDRTRPGPQTGVDNAAVRGVPSTKTSLYDPSLETFECLDGSQIIPFKQVNDDYCDCDDSSDEPGTSACPNGYFYCQNLGYKGYFVPSGWINDNICDCCDGSDEYGGEVFCKDTCVELAQEEYKKYLEIEQVYKQGIQIRAQLIEAAKRIRIENQEKLSKLRADLAEAERIKKEREVIKNQAEEREKVALEKYKPEPQPEEAAAEEAKLVGEEEKEIEEFEAQDYFKSLDSDSNGIVTIADLQTSVIFDKDRNGEVSREEALFFFNNKEELTEEEFIELAWANIKPFLMMNKGLFKPAEKQEIEEEALEEEALHDDDENLDEELETEPLDSTAEEKEIAEEQAELDREAELDKQEDKPEPEEKNAEPQYDEETLAIIEEAKEARTKFQESENAVHELLTEIRKYEERVERDYGPQDEYASLDEQCYEYQTQEYVYSLCLFGRATQRAVSGGSEVSLGQWNSWTGGEGDHKYTAAKYDRGLTCWNGPSRSTLVSIKCGVEAAITSVSEPNRCEYAMELITPAACNINLLDKKYSFDDNLRSEHDEL